MALISDTHGWLPSLSHFTGADVVIHAGDLAPDRSASAWWNGPFCEWVSALGIPFHATYGNHDWPQRAHIQQPPRNLHIHINASVRIGTTYVWFTPYSLPFHDWAWMANEPAIAAMLQHVPHVTSVIVSHGPPYEFGDKNAGGHHCGSTSLRKAAMRLPLVTTVICGHIHEARGKYDLLQRTRDDGIRRVQIFNVASTDVAYNPHVAPVTWFTFD